MLFAGVVGNTWRSLLMLLCEPIYWLIVKVYDLFETVATSSMLNNETINSIYNRVGLLLGIFMLFRVSFSFVQMLINPDLISDKEKGAGNIIKKVIIVIALLGLMPTIFNKALQIQNMVVESNVIAKVILPGERAYSTDFGKNLSAYIFATFYRYDEVFDETKDTPICATLKADPTTGKTYLENYISMNGKIDIAYGCLEDTWEYFDSSQTKWKDKYIISFSTDGIIAVLVGGILVWILLMYTVSVGIRVVQLAFLRLISPLAIMSYLSPKKETTFEKWGKMAITTYIDLFIRLAIIYFVTYVISEIMGNESALVYTSTSNSPDWAVKIIIIIALMFFAKKAPELLKELFPKSGAASIGFGVKSPKSFFKDLPGLKGAKRVAGVATGAAVGSLIGLAAGRNRYKQYKESDAYRDAKKNGDKNAIRRARLQAIGSGAAGSAGGLFRGGYTGKSGKIFADGIKGAAKKQATANASVAEWRAAGGISTVDRVKSGIEKKFGFDTDAIRQQRSIDELQKESERIDREQAPIKATSEVIGQGSKAAATIKSTANAEVKKNKGKIKTNTGSYNVSDNLFVAQADVDARKAQLQQLVSSGTASADTIDAAKQEVAKAEANVGTIENNATKSFMGAQILNSLFGNGSTSTYVDESNVEIANEMNSMKAQLASNPELGNVDVSYTDLDGSTKSGKLSKLMEYIGSTADGTIRSDDDYIAIANIFGKIKDACDLSKGEIDSKLYAGNRQKQDITQEISERKASEEYIAAQADDKYKGSGS